ncbi:MAG TPA: GNAT family N-acetyltransferase [Pseudonocardia sp.]|uniref:GNAT family N-acetyltransferase n=1 Tax=Pseudonocardia sp. TaxID=60912 RepID=UPI002BD0A071|nr:GNAT family N-acetyltransferase [Pseudonocardia sp.]HTF51270.1 GNAT family N-acetyltransferase [Pseudonocardia sp.]
MNALSVMDTGVGPVTLRRARAADLPDLVAMLADDALGARRETTEAGAAALAPYLRAFEEISADDSHILVTASTPTHIVGTLQLSFLPGLSRQGARRAQIEAVRVHRDYRGRRIGDFMIQWAIEEAARRDCVLVQLTTDKRRTDAHRFYRRLGFAASHEGMKRDLTAGPDRPTSGPSVPVTTTYLWQLSPTDLKPASTPARHANVTQVEELAPEFARFLYTAVGGDWYWTDRLDWNLARWTEWLRRPGSEHWVAWIDGAPVGYVELAISPAPDSSNPDLLDAGSAGTHVEIAYFGLLPRFVGRGLGGQLLTEGVRRAWTLHERVPGCAPVERLWLHTCTLDGPQALRNYLARGFQVFRTDTQDEQVGPKPPGPWPGAH